MGGKKKVGRKVGGTISGKRKMVSHPKGPTKKKQKTKNGERGEPCNTKLSHCQKWPG